jgi:hypothetical protein
MTVYPFEKNWRPWLKDQLIKHGLSEKEAPKITRNLVRDVTESHLVLDDVIVPPHLAGQKIRDNISGITVKFGDESHPRNLEIEVGHEIKQEIQAMKEETNEIRRKLDELLKLHKPQLKIHAELVPDIITNKEMKMISNRADTLLIRHGEKRRPVLWPNIPVNDVGRRVGTKPRTKQEKKDQWIGATFKVKGDDVQRLFEYDILFEKIEELIEEGKIMRLKQP